MAIKGAQQFWKTGNRLYVRKRSGGASVLTNPWKDLGIIQSNTPSFDEEDAVLEDSDNGIKQEVLRCVTKLSEAHQVTMSNLNLDNLAYLFRSTAPSSFSQSGGAITDIKHYAVAGELLQLLTGDYDTAGGEPEQAFDVTSIQAVTGTGGSPTHVEGTDWEIVDLQRGLLRIIAGGGISTGEIEVDMTLPAITGNRQLVPTSETDAEVDVKLYWGREGGDEQTVRRFVARVSAPSFDPQADDFASMQLTFNVLDDVALTSEQSGDLIYFRGSLPSAS